MENFLAFLIQPTSLPTIIFPFCLCSLLIGYEMKNSQTDIRYFLCFPLVLILSYCFSSWHVSTSENKDSIYFHIGLHIPSIFAALIIVGYKLQWRLSYAMATVFSYTEILFIDIIQSKTTNITQLLMDNDVDMLTANQVSHDFGPCYIGIGGAGFHDALFFAVFYPSVLMFF